MSKRDDAKSDYMAGRSYTWIAKKYGVSPGTVRAWKSRYGWKQQGTATVQHKNATQQKSATKTQRHVATDKLVNNDELTEKQKLFCLYYLQSFNATQAYMKAYGVKSSTAGTNGFQLLQNTKIKQEIQRLKQQSMKNIYLDVLNLVKSDAKQAFADLGDYMGWQSNEIKLTDNKGKPIKDSHGKPINTHITDIYLTDKDKVDTSMIKSVSKGQNGLKLELKDSDKAKERLYKYFEKADSGDDQINAVDKLLNQIANGAKQDEANNAD